QAARGAARGAGADEGAGHVGPALPDGADPPGGRASLVRVADGAARDAGGVRDGAGGGEVGFRLPRGQGRPSIGGRAGATGRPGALAGTRAERGEGVAVAAAAVRQRGGAG